MTYLSRDNAAPRSTAAADRLPKGFPSDRARPWIVAAPADGLLDEPVPAAPVPWLGTEVGVGSESESESPPQESTRAATKTTAIGTRSFKDAFSLFQGPRVEPTAMVRLASRAHAARLQT